MTYGVRLTAAEAAVIVSALKRLDASLSGPEIIVTNRIAASLAKSGAWSKAVLGDTSSELPARRIIRAREHVAPQTDSGQFVECEPLSSREVAAILGLTANGVRDRRRRGLLRAERVGGRWKFNAADVVAACAKE